MGSRRASASQSWYYPRHCASFRHGLQKKSVAHRGPYRVQCLFRVLTATPKLRRRHRAQTQGDPPTRRMVHPEPSPSDCAGQDQGQSIDTDVLRSARGFCRHLCCRCTCRLASWWRSDGTGCSSRGTVFLGPRYRPLHLAYGVAAWHHRDGCCMLSHGARILLGPRLCSCTPCVTTSNVAARQRLSPPGTQWHSVGTHGVRNACTGTSSTNLQHTHTHHSTMSITARFLARNKCMQVVMRRCYEMTDVCVLSAGCQGLCRSRVTCSILWASLFRTHFLVAL